MDALSAMSIIGCRSRFSKACAVASASVNKSLREFKLFNLRVVLSSSKFIFENTEDMALNLPYFNIFSMIFAETLVIFSSIP